MSLIRTAPKTVPSNLVLARVENTCPTFGSGPSPENPGRKDPLSNISFFSTIGETSVISIMLSTSGSSVSTVLSTSRTTRLRTRPGLPTTSRLKRSLVESTFDN